MTIDDVGSDDSLQVLETLEHSVLDHVDPAGQHADVQNTVESLEHSVLDYILDGRPMEGITSRIISTVYDP